MSAQVNFEKSVDDSSLKEDAFLNLVKNRDQLLEQVFYKIFKPGQGSYNIPAPIQDIMYSLVDGYKSTLLAFGKFEVRQRQQLEYKIERLTKLNADLREEKAR